MSLKIKLTSGGSKTFEAAPEGSYVGTIFKIIDRGTQPKMFKGKHTGDARQLMINYELRDLTNDSNVSSNGEPFTISSIVNISVSSRSTFIKVVKAALGLNEYKRVVAENEEIKIEDLIGKSIFLDVKHNVSGEKTYANVDNQSISQVQPGVVIPELSNKKVYFSLEENEFNPEIYSSLSDSLKDIISKSPEYKKNISNTIEF